MSQASDENQDFFAVTTSVNAARRPQRGADRMGTRLRVVRPETQVIRP
jgi:hypothetical protein